MFSIMNSFDIFGLGHVSCSIYFSTDSKQNNPNNLEFTAIFLKRKTMKNVFFSPLNIGADKGTIKLIYLSRISLGNGNLEKMNEFHPNRIIVSKYTDSLTKCRVQDLKTFPTFKISN